MDQSLIKQTKTEFQRNQTRYIHLPRKYFPIFNISHKWEQVVINSGKKKVTVVQVFFIKTLLGISIIILIFSIPVHFHIIPF